MKENERTLKATILLAVGENNKQYADSLLFKTSTDKESIGKPFLYTIRSTAINKKNLINVKDGRLEIFQNVYDYKNDLHLTMAKNNKIITKLCVSVCIW